MASKIEPQATKYTQMGTYVHEKEIAKGFGIQVGVRRGGVGDQGDPPLLDTLVEHAAIEFKQESCSCIRHIGHSSCDGAWQRARATGSGHDAKTVKGG